MKEIVFFPHSSNGTSQIIGIIIAVFGLLLFLGVWRNRAETSKWVVAGATLVPAIGLAFTLWVTSTARSLSVGPHHLVLRYHWPQPDVDLDADEIRDVRAEARGRNPSPCLVVETVTGKTYVGETGDDEQVERAKRAANRMLGREVR